MYVVENFIILFVLKKTMCNFAKSKVQLWILQTMTKYIPRTLEQKIEKAHKYYQVITLTGPRQSGKSTLCRHLFHDYTYVNFEDIATRSSAMIDPSGFLSSLGKNAIIDEVQHVPDILSQIQVTVDNDASCKYILTGSSNFSLLERVTQSLAGRTALFTLLPFSIDEIRDRLHDKTTDWIMYDGFYPGVIAKDIPADMFYRNYYNTYVERDLRNLLRVNNIINFDRFIRLLANRVGSEFNAAALSREVGVSATTISEWLSLLVTSYIVFQLPPYFNNLSKRITKSSKIYFYDSGLLCSLLGFKAADQMKNSSLRGAVFENMVIVELLKKSCNAGERPDIYFYRENSGIEVDAIVPSVDNIRLYEIKSGQTLLPSFAKNMKSVSEKLSLPVTSTVIYDGPSFIPTALNFRDI